MKKPKLNLSAVGYKGNVVTPQDSLLIHVIGDQ